MKYLELILLSVADIFRQGIGYHSASLTYQFLTVVGSVFMLMGFLSLYMPFLEPLKVYEQVRSFLPYYADAVLSKLIPVYEKKAVGSLLSLLLAYYFSVSFAKTLNTAFGYVYGEKPVRRELFFWTLSPLLLILYLIVLSLTVTLFTLGKSPLGHLYGELLSFLLLCLTVVTLYGSYFGLRVSVFVASGLGALLLLPLNKFFSLLVVKLLSLNPLYSLLGTPLLFLVWLYYSFFCLLTGICFLRRLDQSL
ncbi:MAG: YihY/virulence factor BrkB family protein [Aquificaceae bacterium]|nr:YihY/virulence factor BrkB family protein [Aquificaceae bacterium]MCX8060005.1 YihY/virulence factor BrkB family protein [Aquificaceae bacterium]MDW8097752.1 YhjD/YihY/BrkB family envelope integrity protein [Aquificaceae bacterium]